MTVRNKSEPSIVPHLKVINEISPAYHASFDEWKKGFPVDELKKTFTSIHIKVRLK